MEKFTDLKGLYNHLEKNAADYKYSHQIGELFRELRDLKFKENESEEAKKAQWEVDFFNFWVKDGKINPKFTKTNEKGEVIEYPNLDRLDDKTCKYLIERLDNTSNPLLKARYSLILWCSPYKHAKYAKIAIDSYLKLIKIYETKDGKEPQGHYGLDILDAIKNAHSLTCQVRYKLEKVKSEIRRLVDGFNFKSSSSFALRARLIDLMLQDKRRFSKEDFVGFEHICWKILRSLEKSNIHGAIQMLELGEKVDEKQGKKTHEWRRQIAELYETLMRARENDFASLTFCQLAIDNYKKIKDEKKIKELEKRYSELKGSVKLRKFEMKIDLTEHVKKCREIAEKITQNKPEEIIKFLMLDKNLLPRFKDMEKVSGELNKEYPLQHLFPKEIIDQSGHTAQHFSDENERKYYGMLQQYDMELKLNKMYLINEIFFAAIQERKLSASILLEFLRQYSWFGKNIPKKLEKDKIIQYNWLNLIAPALHEYFLQIHYYFQNPANYPNLVLSIDSLTLKIEGLLRDICRFAGVPTFYTTKDRNGRNIAREKDIHALLHEKAVKKLFDEDDLLFFKFLLVEQAGYNLRHRIAHSLMLFREYRIIYMHLLIFALLKLGKYDFVKREDNKAQNDG